MYPPGKIARFDDQGKPVGEATQIESQYLRLLVAAGDDANATTSFAGMAYAAAENGAVTDVLVGVDPAGKALWTYPLPTGQQPWLEQVALGRVTGGDKHWIVAAADGSCTLSPWMAGRSISSTPERPSRALRRLSSTASRT